MVNPWHTIRVLAKCQSLKLECEHTLTKKVLALPLDYPRLETSYRWVLPISPGRPEKKHELTLPVGCENHLSHEGQGPSLVTNPAALPHPVPSASWSDTLYPTKLTHHWVSEIKWHRWHRYGIPPLPTARLMVTAGHCMPQEPKGWTQWVRRGGDDVQRGRWKITASSSTIALSCS